MNKLLLCLILLIPLPMLDLGCAMGGSVETISYKTLGATVHAVDASMKSFADLQVRGFVTEAQTAQIRSLYQEYQSSMSLALVLASQDYKAQTPDELAQLAADLITFIQKLQ